MHFSLLLLAALAVIDNGELRVESNDAGEIAVTDHKSGKRWRSLRDERTSKASEIRKDAEAIVCKIEAGEFAAKGEWRLEGRELVFTLDANLGAAMRENVYYPAPFAAKRGERLLLPHGCGFAFDAGETDLGGDKRMDEMRFYERDMKLGCFAHYGEHVTADGSWQQDAGYLAILPAPYNAKVDFRVRGNGCRAVSAVWLPNKGKFSYRREIRYVFFAKADPITMARRYREHAKQRGYVVTWREKAARNSVLAANYEIFKGAPDVWFWEIDGEKGKFAAELRELGFDNFIFSTVTRRDLGVWITPEEVRDIVKTPRVLVAEYDIYRDTLERSMLDKIDAIRPQWPLSAWERDDIVYKADGTPQRGWKVALKSDPTKPVIGCLHLCEARAMPYVRERLTKRLAEAPFTVRFLDVTGTSLGECYNPKHPLDRRASERERVATFEAIGREFNQFCGAEDGLECFVPCCDYFEGNFSAPYYRVDGGRFMWKIYEKSPEIMRRAIDPKTRLPFFEMVFHDCISSYWYWTDYNNRFEDAWWQRDLLNALTGTPPMYMFTRGVFARQRGRLAASVRVTTPIARATADATIVSWKWLTADRLVQQSSFSNGVSVTVNFSEREYRFADGRVVSPYGHLFENIK